MSFRIGGVVFSRLLLALSVILMPLYFLLLFALSPVKILPTPLSFDIMFFNFPLLHVIFQYFEYGQPLFMLFNYVFAPLYFSLPWILFVFLNRERILKTFELLDTTTTIVPLRYRIFYGWNTLILIAFFVIPFLFPFLSVVASVILAGRALNTSEWFWRQRRLIKLIAVIVMLVTVCGGPIYLTVLYYLEKIHNFIAGWFWELWVNNMVVTYTISMCIVNALAVGSVVWLIFAGAAEFEARTFGMALTKPPYRAIVMLEVFLFVIFAYIGLPYIYFPGWAPHYIIWGSNPRILYDGINYIGLGLMSLVILITMIRGLRKNKFNISLFGLIIAGGFLGLDMITGNHLRTLAILPKTLTPYIIQMATPFPWMLLINANYLLNLYIPYYEIPRVLLEIYFLSGEQAALSIATYITMLIQSSVSYMTSAMVVTAVIWFLTSTYCFIKATS